MSLPAQNVRFGPFQLDLRAAELRRNGTTIKLPEQPFQILAELVEHPGEVVTREELRQRLWRSDTFVDFEHGLNTVVKHLRELLGDSAEKPQYIETVPRRGYRLMVPVERALPVATRAEVSTRHLKVWFVGPVVVVAALAASLVWRQELLERFRPVNIDSVALLPLENLSRNPEEEYFVDGMTEALITELGKVHALRVISRQSVMHYKGTNKTVPQIASELHVDAVVEGSALRAGGKVRITAQLIQANPERHLWSETYERRLGDVLLLQGDVARAIAQQISINLAPPKQPARLANRVVNQDAYDMYLRGRHHLDKRSEEELRKGLDLFQRSIEKDPDFALAYVGVADSYLLLENYGVVAQQDAYLKAGAAISQALAIDNKLSNAHNTLAALYLGDWNWPQAEKEFREAVLLDPNSARTHHWYGDFLSVMGRFDESVAEFRRGLELEPNSLIINTELALTLLNSGRSDEALQPARQAAEMDAAFAPGRAALGLAYVRNGMAARGISELKESIALSKGTPLFLASLAYGYARTGQKREACQIVEEMKQLAARKYVPPYLVSSAYASCGQRKQALLWLEKAYREHDSWLFYMKTDVLVESLRSDPRFQDLLRRMNFPP